MQWGATDSGLLSILSIFLC